MKADKVHGAECHMFGSAVLHRPSMNCSQVNTDLDTHHNTASLISGFRRDRFSFYVDSTDRSHRFAKIEKVVGLEKTHAALISQADRSIDRSRVAG